MSKKWFDWYVRQVSKEKQWATYRDRSASVEIAPAYQNAITKTASHYKVSESRR